MNHRQVYARCHHCTADKTMLRISDPLCARCRAMFNFYRLVDLDKRYDRGQEEAPAALRGALN